MFANVLTHLCFRISFLYSLSLFKKIIDLFGCAGSSLLQELSPSCSEQGLLSAVVRIAGASRVVEHRP